MRAWKGTISGYNSVHAGYTQIVSKMSHLTYVNNVMSDNPRSNFPEITSLRKRKELRFVLSSEDPKLIRAESHE